MNIFTRFLSQFSGDSSLGAFVARWDVVEEVVVRAYRGGEVTAEDGALYLEARGWLRDHYGGWAARLRPYWQNSKVGGTLEHGDPFLFLLAYEEAADFVDNWSAMQHLPAAREALNGLIVATTGEQ